MKWESRVSLSAVILSKALHTASTREEISLWGQVRYRVEPEPGSKVHGEPWIRQLPDPDPAATGNIRIWIRFGRIVLGRGRRSWEKKRKGEEGEYLSALHMPQSISYIMLSKVYPAEPDPDPDVAGSRSG